MAQALARYPNLIFLARNVSEPLQGQRQTNQRAELTAISRALGTVPSEDNLIIITDSKYAIDCLTNWCHKWQQNGWKTQQGNIVENRDLIEGILDQIQARESVSSRTKFEWVKGHAGSQGNAEADRLAVEGARKGILGCSGREQV